MLKRGLVMLIAVSIVMTVAIPAYAASKRDHRAMVAGLVRPSDVPKGWSADTKTSGGGFASKPVQKLAAQIPTCGALSRTAKAAAKLPTTMSPRYTLSSSEFDNAIVRYKDVASAKRAFRTYARHDTTACVQQLFGGLMSATLGSDGSTDIAVEDVPVRIPRVGDQSTGTGVQVNVTSDGKVYQTMLGVEFVRVGKFIVTYSSIVGVGDVVSGTGFQNTAVKTSIKRMEKALG